MFGFDVVMLNVFPIIAVLNIMQSYVGLVSDSRSYRTDVIVSIILI